MAQGIGHRHFVFDEWSRAHSPLHSLDARLKLLATVALLVVTATWPRAWWLFALAAVLILLARIPFPGLAVRVAVVLPFTLTFAVATWWAGDPARALTLLWRSYLSALWAGLLMATTPLEEVLLAARRLGAPRLLIDVMQFTWRYLGVITEQAWRMRTAALARGADRSFQVSAASLAVLFASSYNRAERIHRAMAARGAGGAP
jgi:cobalt/nickel transport system permease protein